jgi:septum formation inhibitor MinC
MIVKPCTRHSLEAELVPIAGYYRIIEDMPSAAFDKSVQVSLAREKLEFVNLMKKAPDRLCL